MAGVEHARADLFQRVWPGVIVEDAIHDRFVAALALGDTRGLDDHDWEVLRATGLTHLIAISGFHVGLVAGIGALLARAAWWAWPPLARWLARPTGAV